MFSIPIITILILTYPVVSLILISRNSKIATKLIDGKYYYNIARIHNKVPEDKRIIDTEADIVRKILKNNYHIRWNPIRDQEQYDAYVEYYEVFNNVNFEYLEKKWLKNSKPDRLTGKKNNITSVVDLLWQSNMEGINDHSNR